MFDDLTQLIEELHLLLFRDIKILDDKMVMTAETSSSSSYQLICEIVRISESIDKQVYDFAYLDDKDMVMITRKGTG